MFPQGPKLLFLQLKCILSLERKQWVIYSKVKWAILFLSQSRFGVLEEMQETVGPPGTLDVSAYEGIKYVLKEKQEPLLEIL